MSAPPHSTLRLGLASALLLTGLALAGYTLYASSRTASVNVTPSVALITEPAELTSRGREVVGAYATGTQPGDRTITITADGRIKFLAVGSKDDFANNTDTYQLGRRDKNYCLLTAASGVVEFTNPDTVVYYRDTYRRTR